LPAGFAKVVQPASKSLRRPSAAPIGQPAGPPPVGRRRQFFKIRPGGLPEPVSRQPLAGPVQSIPRPTGFSMTATRLREAGMIVFWRRASASSSLRAGLRRKSFAALVASSRNENLVSRRANPRISRFDNPANRTDQLDHGIHRRRPSGHFNFRPRPLPPAPAQSTARRKTKAPPGSSAVGARKRRTNGNLSVHRPNRAKTSCRKLSSDISTEIFDSCPNCLTIRASGNKSSPMCRRFCGTFFQSAPRCCRPRNW